MSSLSLYSKNRG
ncbi:hypothetical protein PENARI_c040G05916 [Penicillium arizonense]|uniref:Uncharacterized protein n=1 Tax=Penicillium arizonense TaxID=1835702 RepID=A0A1F5L3R0_PENAI|nr:hypothetical protein PENARI_c040G05916 [Penicillium arizonense]